MLKMVATYPLDWLITMWNDILNWTGFVAGGGVLAWVALAFLAPGVLDVIKSLLTGTQPLLKGISEGVVNLVKILWDGIKDIADNLNTVLTVILLCLVVFLYAKLENARVCEEPDYQAWMEKNIRPDYKFVKRTPQEKAEYLRRTGQTQQNSYRKWIPW